MQVDVPDDQGYGQGWKPTEQCMTHAPKCPDDGRCWHLCGVGPCWRVLNAGPLTAYGEDWTDADRARAASLT